MRIFRPCSANPAASYNVKSLSALIIPGDIISFSGGCTSMHFQTQVDSAKKPTRHIWSLLSVSVSVAHYFVLDGIAAYLQRRDVRLHSSRYPASVGGLHLFFLLLSIATAVNSLEVERPRIIGYFALCFGVFTFLFYVG